MKPQVKQKHSHHHHHHHRPLLPIAAVLAATDTQIRVPNNSVTVLKWLEAIC
jgi:uncharacterized protein (DUF111 family)